MTIQSFEPLRVMQDMEDGHAYVDCPSCAWHLDPMLHLKNPCQAGCSTEWQTAGPHLRWSCVRCGWGADNACTPPNSKFDESGRVIPPNVEDIPF